MATIHWRGKHRDRAQLDWIENGRRHRISIGKISAQDAETIRLEKELELRTGASSQLAPGFQEFAVEYLNWHKFEYPASHNRIHQITHDYLIPHYQETPLDQISPLTVELYKQTRSAAQVIGRHKKPRPLKKETINKELRVFNAILNKAVEWLAIPANPIIKLPTIKNIDSTPPRYYTKTELDAIYAAAPYNWFVWRFLSNTGLRRAELLKLEWQHIKDDTILVLSSEENRTKSGKWRPVPMSPGAKLALERFARDNKKRIGRIITETGPSLSRAFSRVLDRSDIDKPRGSLHSLRHTFCSHLVMSGVDLTTVQRLAGHSTIRVTEQYAHLAPDHLKESAQRLDL